MKVFAMLELLTVPFRVSGYLKGEVARDMRTLACMYNVHNLCSNVRTQKKCVCV